MNRQAVISDMRKVWEFAKLLELGELFTNPVPLEPSEEFRGIALDFNATYEDLYLSGLRNGDYNIQLIDYSYFQFGWSKDAHVRFAYYPNPFLGVSTTAVAEVNDLRSYVEEGVFEIEEFLYRVAELRNSQHPPLTRYENAPDHYLEFEHPCSHFHFGHHTENRWALQRVLSPFAFAMIIFKHYYAAAWNSRTKLKLFEREDFANGFLAFEKGSCRVLAEDLFSSGAQSLFAFR